MKLGARILKTGIAITLALLLAKLLDLPSPVFAGISAIFAIQPTIYRSYLSIIEQIQGNIIGAFFAFVFVLLFGNNFFVVGLAAIIVILINLKLNLEKTISLSLITMIVIMETPGEQFVQFALIRFSTLLLGVLSAFVVNLVFIPPKYENKLYFKLTDLTEDITKWIRINTRHASEHQSLKIDIDKLKENMIRLDQLYLLYKEERNYFKKNDLVKSRKLVIYRQMITAVKSALNTLRKLHRFENELSSMPDEFQNAIQQQLDCAIYHHEQIMLKFIGKIRMSSPDEDGIVCVDKKELFELFLEQQKAMNDLENPILFHMMQIISAIIDYGEQVEHLDTLINSFQSFHKDENEVSIREQQED